MWRSAVFLSETNHRVFIAAFELAELVRGHRPRKPVIALRAQRRMASSACDGPSPSSMRCSAVATAMCRLVVCPGEYLPDVGFRITTYSGRHPRSVANRDRATHRGLGTAVG